MIGFQPALIVAAHQHAVQGLKRGADRRDVKNEGRTDYVYENKAMVTKCTETKTAFLHENAPNYAMIANNRSDFLAENATTGRPLEGTNPWIPP
jgi:geranylgeranyl pyrophosphate synthase